MSEQKRPLGYLGGDIMTHGSNLARQEEYDKFKEAHIPGEVYSPVQNKSINDKSNMTEEENNHLAEKLLWPMLKDYGIVIILFYVQNKALLVQCVKWVFSMDGNIWHKN